MNQDIRIEIVQDIERLNKMQTTWDYLLERCPEKNPFLTFSWNAAWWETYGNDRRLFVIIIYFDTQAMGIFPLMISKKTVGVLTCKKMEFIGAGRSDYMGPIIVNNPKACWFHAIEAIYDHCILWDVVEFGRIIEESDSFQKLHEVIASKKLHRKVELCVSQRGSPSIQIEGDWEEYYKQRRSRVRRKEARRNLRSLTKEGVLTFSESNAEKDLDYLLGELAHLESKAWKGIEKKGIFINDLDRNFILKVSFAFADSGWLSIHSMRIDDKLIAFVYSFKYNHRYYAYSTSYDPEYKLASPGSLLLQHTIQECFRNSFIEYDFLQGEEKYKLIWTNKFRKISRILLLHQGRVSFILFLQEKHIRPLVITIKKKIIAMVSKHGYEMTVTKEGKRRLIKKLVS